MKRILLITAALWFPLLFFAQKPTAPVRSIAEFEPMQGVIVRYPFGIPTSLVKEMAKVVKVTTLVENDFAKYAVMQTYQKEGVDMNNVDFITVTTDSYWTRDFGPWFIFDGNDEIGVVDFEYNRPRPYDDSAMETISKSLGTNYFYMDLAQTGGNYMSDGYGGAAATSLVLTENPTKTNAEVRQLMKDYLGIENYLLFSDPMDDYIEHIDCWGKFLAVDKVLIGQVPQSDYRYADYEATAQAFAATTSSWGDKYQVYRIYSPGTTALNTDVTPYTNSLILNDHVFVAQTGSAYDDNAIKTYQQAMPGYTIVPVEENYDTPWENTDALHCRTHEVPDFGMLDIRHYPLLGEQTYREDFAVTADIIAHSGESLLADSVLLHFQVDTNAWQSVKMQPVGGYAWRGEFPKLPSVAKVHYYLSAQDLSGRHENHPYVGAADPHFFWVKDSVADAANDTSDTDTVAIIPVIPISVSSYDTSYYTVYPNPAKDCFSVVGDKIASIFVYDMLGHLIDERQQCGTNAVRIFTSDWADGFYFVKVYNPKGDYSIRKVVVRK